VNKKAAICLALLLFCVPVQSKAFVNLFVRVGLFYTAYKFVDGVVEGSISNFVDQYIDGPIDIACSYGQGVKIFGTGVRQVIINFSNDSTNNSISNAWQDLKEQLDYAVAAGKAEWAMRRAFILKKSSTNKKLLKVKQELKDDADILKKKPSGEFMNKKLQSD